MVHTTPDAQGRVKVTRDPARLTLGCYNFDMDNAVRLTVETEEAFDIPPLCRLSVPDQVGGDFEGASTNRNYWVTKIGIGDQI